MSEHKRDAHGRDTDGQVDVLLVDKTGTLNVRWLRRAVL